MKENLNTKQEITWCPGCPNFVILESAKKAIANLISHGEKQESFAMATDIGCSSKIFDYINISGFYGLHGRAIPTAGGMSLGNPNLHVLAFLGDGGAYAEGISHLLHSARYNANVTAVIHDNQSFSLTTGQPTPTSQQGMKSKSVLVVVDEPFNPIKLMLASNCTFIARCNAKDMNHTAEVLEKAIKHNGFSFVEIIQDCLIFNKEINNKDPMMYKIPDNKNKTKAESLADQWDYNGKKGKIPLGVIYQVQKPSLVDNWPQLTELKKKKISWKNK